MITIRRAQETDLGSIQKVIETAFSDEENKVIMNLAQELSKGHLEKRRYLHLHPLIKKHLTVPKGKYLHINRVIKEAQVVFDQ